MRRWRRPVEPGRLMMNKSLSSQLACPRRRSYGENAKSPKRKENRSDSERRNSCQHSVFVMTRMLRGVLTRGTAQRAAGLAAHGTLAGKTGTIAENTDAWFIELAPNIITVGVWIGLTKEPLGRERAGARSPRFRCGWNARRRTSTGSPTRTIPHNFEPPGNIMFLR